LHPAKSPVVNVLVRTDDKDKANALVVLHDLDGEIDATPVS
jgi:hypothetical protein